MMYIANKRRMQTLSFNSLLCCCVCHTRFITVIIIIIIIIYSLPFYCFTSLGPGWDYRSSQNTHTQTGENTSARVHTQKWRFGRSGRTFRSNAETMRGTGGGRWAATIIHFTYTIYWSERPTRTGAGSRGRRSGNTMTAVALLPPPRSRSITFAPRAPDLACRATTYPETAGTR